MIAGTRQIVNSQPMIDPRDQAALEYAYWDKKRQQMQNDAMDRIAAKNAGENNRDNSGAPFTTNSSPADVKTEENLKKYSDLYNSLHTGKGGKYNREYFFNEKCYTLWTIFFFNDIFTHINERLTWCKWILPIIIY